MVPVFIKPVAITTPPRHQHNLTLKLAYIDSPRDICRQSSTQPTGFVRGVLVRSGHMNTGKHMHCVIYQKDNNQNQIPIPRSIWKLYEEDRKLTRGIPARELTSDDDPLFYLMDPGARTPDNPGGLVFFGPTMMFRIPYTHDIKDFVPQHLRDNKVIDLADSIFGTTETTPAIKGRVFFEDAKLLHNNGNVFSESERWPHYSEMY